MLISDCYIRYIIYGHLPTIRFDVNVKVMKGIWFIVSLSSTQLNSLNTYILLALLIVSKSKILC